MPDGPIGLRVEIADHGSATVVAVGGEIDVATAAQLTEAARSLGPGDGPVVLDLEHVSFMDSSGMRSLLDFSQMVEGSGRPLALLRPSPAVTRLLELVDLRHRFTEVDHTSD